MALDVHQFACLSDNYGFLARDRATGLIAAVDTPDAQAILRELEGLGWRLSMILNTHWHADHAGGNEALKAATGCEIVGPSEVRRMGPVDRVVGEADVVMLGETRFQVLGVGGHTLGHIAYYDAADEVAFVGDTLFAMGCGRLFEGDPAMMWTSLSKLAALPEETRVYCAHEYTASNARFALSVDDDPAVASRAREVFAARERGEATVPTTIGAEKAANPFLRAPKLARRMGLEGATEVEVFAAVRAAKDAFR
jgi:hydroxyacylglutathione hydrolase